MNVFRFLIAVLCLPTLACHKLNNNYKLLVLSCGAIDPGDSGLSWLRLELPAELDTKQVQAIGLHHSTISVLKASPLGCIGVGPQLDTVLLRHPLAPYAARIERATWQDRDLVKVELKTDSPLGFTKETLAFHCNQTIGRAPTYNFTASAQASIHQHFYMSQAQVLDAKDHSLKGLSQLTLAGENPYRLNLPLLLQDGAYRLELITQDIFELELNGVKAKPLTCEWNLDTHYPLVQGFREPLKLISAEDTKLLEVKPGQTLTLAVDDSGDSLINVCLAPLAATKCEDFFQLKNAFYAPTSGTWRVFYFTQDLAGNRSPINVLADLAVINRDLIQSIQSRLNVAALQSEKAEAMEANWSLLRAFRDYYNLPLAIERSFLSKLIATTFTDVAHNNSLQLETKDHSAAVKKYQLFKPDRVTISLDLDGNLKARSFDGPLLQSLAQVADFTIRDGQDLVILFKNGIIKHGLNGPSQTLAFDIGEAQWLVANPASRAWAVSGTKGFGVLSDLEHLNQILWTQSQDQGVRMLGFDPSGQRLAVIANDKSFIVFNSSSGQQESRRELNSLCNYRQGVLTPRGLFIAAYETHEVQTDQFFRCELLVWTGEGAPAPLPLPEITDSSSLPEYDPNNYRLDDVVQLSYSPAKNWLAISRNLADRSCFIYDLTKNHGRIFYQPEGENKNGRISALHLDEDGQYFALSINDVSAGDAQNSLDVWQLGSTELADLSTNLPILSLNGLKGAIQNIATIAEKNWIATIDDTRTTKAYSVLDHEGFQLESIYKLPLTQLAEQDSLATVQNSEVVLFDRFAAPIARWVLGENRLVFVKGHEVGQILAVDDQGGVMAGKIGEKNLSRVGQSIVRTVEEVFLSPKNELVLLTGLDEEAKPKSELMVHIEGSWVTQAQFDLKVNGATWSLDEALFAVGSFKGESLLINRQGTILLKTMAKRNNGFPAKQDQRFSQDGSRWVVQVDSHLEVYDTRTLSKIGQNLEIPTQTRRFSFAGNSLDEFLLAYATENNRYTAARLTGQGALEFLANFDGMVETMSEQASVVTIYAQNLYLLGAKIKEALPEFQKNLGFLASSFGENETLVVSGPREFSYELAFRQEDPRLLLKLCKWMEAMLLKDEHAETMEWRNYCGDAKAGLVH